MISIVLEENLLEPTLLYLQLKIAAFAHVYLQQILKYH